MRILFLIVFVSLTSLSYAQRIDFENDKGITQNLFIKLYGNIDYNQPIVPGVKKLGTIDVHRIVTLFGYQFSPNTQFVSELEVEHANEVFIEQAFVKHKVVPNHFLKAGLILIPMGYINENHEATAFYSVERPFIDRDLVPSTWREAGIGMTGVFSGLGIRYKAFLVNGFRSYDDDATLQGSNGLRGGRQKGIKSKLSSLPNISAQLEYIGIPNSKIALSYYGGQTQSDLYDNLEENDLQAYAIADSSVVGLQMVGLHSQSTLNKFQINTQAVVASMANTASYNQFTGKDLGSLMWGYYVELAYQIFNSKTSDDSVTLFSRWSQYDTHGDTVGEVVNNQSYQRSIFTLGANYNPSKGVVFKTDFQWIGNQGSDNLTYQFNLGTGVWF